MTIRLYPLILLLLFSTFNNSFAEDYESDRVFIKFEDDAQSRVLSSHQLTDTRPAFTVNRDERRRGNSKLDRIYISRITGDEDPAEVAESIANQPGVVYAEPVPVYKTLSTPNDPKYIGGEQSYLDLINAPQAWSITTGSEEVTIAIIDSGTDIDHIDLADNTWVNPDEEEDGEDNSGSGKADDIHGWDFYEDNNDPRPGSSVHGTHVAGIAAAVTDNEEGVASLGHSVSYMPLKVGDGDGSINGEAAYNAMLYAAEQGVEVINNSWGGTAFSQTAALVVSEVYEMGSVIVAAAGNDGDEQIFYPAGYPEVTAVGSVNEDEQKSGFSNFGPFVGVMAPGEKIYSTENDDEYGPSSGTSMAAPVVSALAGLIASHHSDYTNDQIRAQLKASASELHFDIEDPWRKQLGEGMIDAAAALAEPMLYLHAADYHYTDTDSDTPASFIAASTFDLHIDWHNLGVDLSGAEVSFETFAPGEDENVTANDAVVPASESISLNSFDHGERIEAEPVEFNITGQAFGINNQRIVIKANVIADGQRIASPTFEFTLNQTEMVMNANTISLTLGSNGRIGWQDYPDFDEGESFVISGPDTDKLSDHLTNAPLLREGGLMFADSPDASSTRISNAIRRSEDFADNHFSTREPFQIESDSETGIQRGEVSFTDGDASEPYNVITELTSKSVNDEELDQVIMLNYRFINDGDLTLNDFQTGLFLDWVFPLNTDNPLSLQETLDADVNEDDQIIYVSDWGDENDFYAGATLVEPLGTGYLISNSGDPGLIDIQDEFTLEDKGLALSRGIRPLDDFDDARDISMVVGPPSFSMEPGESKEATWILGWGNSYEELAQNLANGREYAAETFTSSPDTPVAELPEESEISRAFPNPFNSQSTIELQISEQGRYELELINILGQSVKHVESADFTTGNHTVTVDGSSLATGAYHLLLHQDGKIVDTKGITLVK